MRSHQLRNPNHKVPQASHGVAVEWVWHHGEAGDIVIRACHGAPVGLQGDRGFKAARGIAKSRDVKQGQTVVRCANLGVKRVFYTLATGLVPES